jgi:hypothetical protein
MPNMDTALLALEDAVTQFKIARDAIIVVRRGGMSGLTLTAGQLTTMNTQVTTAIAAGKAAIVSTEQALQ